MSLKIAATLTVVGHWNWQVVTLIVQRYSIAIEKILVLNFLWGKISLLFWVWNSLAPTPFSPIDNCLEIFYNMRYVRNATNVLLHNYQDLKGVFKICYKVYKNNHKECKGDCRFWNLEQNTVLEEHSNQAGWIWNFLSISLHRCNLTCWVLSALWFLHRDNVTVDHLQAPVFGNYNQSHHNQIYKEKNQPPLDFMGLRLKLWLSK